MEFVPWTDPAAPAPAAAPWLDTEEVDLCLWRASFLDGDAGFGRIGLWGRRSSLHRAFLVARFPLQDADAELQMLVRVGKYAQVLVAFFGEALDVAPPTLASWLEVHR